MCRAEDHRFKTASKAVTASKAITHPLAVKCDRTRLGLASIFKPRHHSPKCTTPTGVSTVKSFFEDPPVWPAKTNASVATEIASNKSKVPSDGEKLPLAVGIGESQGSTPGLSPESTRIAFKLSSEESSPNFVLRPSLTKSSGDEVSNTSDVSMGISEDQDMMAIKRSKSFDESREDDLSIMWTRSSTSTKSTVKFNGRLRRDLDFMRDVPSGGIVQLPRAAFATRKGFSFSSEVSETDITIPMGNLKMRPEPLHFEDESKEESEPFQECYNTPEVTFRLYEDIPTPPTPKHIVKICHFDHFPEDVPAHLMLPTFLS